MVHRAIGVALLPMLLLVGCGGSDSKSYLDVCRPSPDFAPGQGNPFPPGSPRLAAKAARLLRTDSEFQALIGGRRFTVTREIPWTAGSGALATGFVVSMRFTPPAALGSAHWPLVIYPGAGRPDQDTTPRLLCEVDHQAQNVTKVEATVNLTSHRVESVSAPNAPISDSEIGSLPDKYRPVPGY
jgi:hypothetical protein